MRSLIGPPVFLVLLPVAALGFEPDCSFSGDAYAVERTTSNVAPSHWGPYPAYLLWDVQAVVQGYLSERESDPYGCFYHPGSAGVPLNLFCDIARTGDVLSLHVRIDSAKTGESLLDFKTSSLMFRPSAAVSEFASAFPRLFKGEIFRHYDYKPPALGFRGGALGRLYLENILYGGSASFEADFSWSAPAEIIGAIDAMHKRRWAALYTGGAVSAAGLIAAGIATRIDAERGLTERESNAFKIVLFGSGALSVLSVAWFLLPPGPRLVRRMNEWLESSLHLEDSRM